ncbi:hypothetical protein TEA_027389 [Camellia sinensis var. sinensis]|uniref:cellulase n=1 Tax=Camellia sinensis var. sinensis TaxID=542762 RepID=A0A4S4D8N6_CAMSN|nr:hypothetical protein TEA_027389 [Camellia sinensis var. sinensis]
MQRKLMFLAFKPPSCLAGISHSDGTADREGDEQLLRVILFEDVSEYLFSISSEEARLSLVFQFIDFYGGRISKWTCTNSSSWSAKTLSLESLPDSILDHLRRVHDVISKTERSPSNFSFEFLLGSSNDISMRTDMMKFLCNATLLCLTAFPRNYILEEAVLVAEELWNTKMNSCSCSVTPRRALAKRLVKSNRQDVLLCGVYARREAAYGNIDHARKVFDMALASIEGLPSEDMKEVEKIRTYRFLLVSSDLYLLKRMERTEMTSINRKMTWRVPDMYMDLRSNTSLLYFWYAEMEMDNSSGSVSESLLRAIHILCCFGSGVKYTAFKCQPSNLQQLRARQGFKERIRIQRSTWARGVIDDHSIALICSAALFEELTAGCVAGIDVLKQAFSMVLPGSVNILSIVTYNAQRSGYLQRPEDMPTSRQVYKIYPNNPGSDLAGETTAAMTAASVVFRHHNPSYANELLHVVILLCKESVCNSTLSQPNCFKPCLGTSISSIAERQVHFSEDSSLPLLKVSVKACRIRDFQKPATWNTSFGIKGISETMCFSWNALPDCVPLHISSERAHVSPLFLSLTLHPRGALYLVQEVHFTELMLRDGGIYLLLGPRGALYDSPLYLPLASDPPNCL